jgi:hypothetical protein
MEEALASGRLVDNLQARMLCGLEGSLTRPADGELLDAALGELRSLAFVGLTERFAESLLLAGECLDLRALAYRAKRVHGLRAEPTAVEALRAHNELDLELYREARALVDSQLDRMPRSRADALMGADAFLRTGRPALAPRTITAVLGYWATSLRVACVRRAAQARKLGAARMVRTLTHG